MASFKMGRIAADMQRELSALFREVKDPRVSGLLSIVKIDVSGDLSYAKVYISAIDGPDATARSVAGLKSAAGFLRRELGRRLSLRKAPELRFVADDSIVQSAHIARIIDSFDNLEEEKQAGE
ncbi:MAG: 30S ribosome-binding factor RbfA [Clostridiales bacterium]|nr:30S ribosome-binding factor RbfA [Clostridiales bacterium]